MYNFHLTITFVHLPPACWLQLLQLWLEDPHGNGDISDAVWSLETSKIHCIVNWIWIFNVDNLEIELHCWYRMASLVSTHLNPDLIIGDHSSMIGEISKPSENNWAHFNYSPAGKDFWHPGPIKPWTEPEKSKFFGPNSTRLYSTWSGSDWNNFIINPKLPGFGLQQTCEYDQKWSNNILHNANQRPVPVFA